MIDERRSRRGFGEEQCETGGEIRQRCERGKLEEFTGEGDGGEIGEGKRLSEVAGGELGMEMSMEGMAVRWS